MTDPRYAAVVLLLLSLLLPSSSFAKHSTAMAPIAARTVSSPQPATQRQQQQPAATPDPTIPSKNKAMHEAIAL